MLKAKVSLILLILLSTVFIIALTKTASITIQAASGIGGTCTQQSDCTQGFRNQTVVCCPTNTVQANTCQVQTNSQATNCGGPGASSSTTPITNVAVGGTCSLQNYTCPTDYTNFYQAVSEGSILLNGNNLNSNDLLTLLSNEYASKTAQICVNNSNLESGITTGFDNRTGDIGKLPGGQDDIPRLCPVNTSPQASFLTRSQIPNPPYGCCPTGSQFVTGLDMDVLPNVGTFMADANHYACCPTNGSASPQFWDGTNCLSNSKNVITYNDGGASIKKGTDHPEELGLPIGHSVVSSNGYLSSGTAPSNNITCPLSGYTDGCALVNSGSSQQLPSGITSLSGTTVPQYYVASPENMYDNGSSKATVVAQCMSCIKNNSAIGTLTNTQTGKTDIILCQKGKYLQTPLINNSLADTLATLNTDPANAKIIADCTAAGGIPTAIGCIDTTPLGIITGLIRIALGVVGGIALIELMLVGIQYQRGDEEGIKKARERLIATLTGVAFLIFSVLILRILGVNVLDILPKGSI